MLSTVRVAVDLPVNGLCRSRITWRFLPFSFSNGRFFTEKNRHKCFSFALTPAFLSVIHTS